VSRIKTILKGTLRMVETAEGAVCAIGLFITSLLIFVQVINRYFVHLEIMWLSDLALYVFVFFMLLAAAYATWREGHVAVDFLREGIVRGRPVLAAAYRIALDVLSIAALCTIMPVAFAFMKRAMKYPEYGTLVRWFNTSWLQVTLFVSLVLVFVHLLVILGRDIGELHRTWRRNALE
jgi:C4-dicarboxylate transporter DctQ subunit